MTPLRPAFLFILGNLLLVTAISVPFWLDLAPTGLLAALVPLAQWSVTLVAVLVNRGLPQGRLGELLALRRGNRLGRGLLLMLAVVAGVPLLQLGLGQVFGLTTWAPHESVLLALTVVPIILLLQTLFAAGEELGWRGYLQTLLRRRLNFWQTVAITAAVWGLWHVPVAIDLALDGELPTRMAITYVLDILPWAAVLAASRERFDSVWPAVFGHGLINSVRVLILQNLTTPEARLTDLQFWTLHALGWVLWLGAGWWLWRSARRRPAVAPDQTAVGTTSPLR